MYHFSRSIYLELALDPTRYVAQDLGWIDLERLVFVSGDGVNFNVNGLSWLMDDVDVAGVPEPATLSLMAAGLLSLAMSRRRRLRGSSR